MSESQPRKDRRYRGDTQRPSDNQTSAMVATKRKVFVVGLHRSGTSILSELLKAHPNICGHNVAEMPPELENEGQHVQVARARG